MVLSFVNFNFLPLFLTFHQRLLSVHSLDVFQTCLDFDVFYHKSIYIFKNAFQNFCLKVLKRFLISPTLA